MAGYTFKYYINNAGHTLNDESTTFLLGARGMAQPRVEMPMMRRPYTDGARLIGTTPTLPTAMTLAQEWTVNPYTYMPPREIELLIGMKAASYSAWVSAYKTMVHDLTPYEEASALYTPFLQVTAPSTTVYDLECRLKAISEPQMEGPGYGTYTLTFLAERPYFHLAFAIDNSTLLDANPDSITNPGDAPIWPDIWVDGSLSTTIVGLHLINATTGKVWSTSQTLAIASWLRVNMLTGEVTYSTDGGTTYTNIISTMDADAEFWNMPVGTNSIQWTSTSGTPAGISVFHAWNYIWV